MFRATGVNDYRMSSSILVSSPNFERPNTGRIRSLSLIALSLARRKGL